MVQNRMLIFELIFQAAKLDTGAANRFVKHALWQSKKQEQKQEQEQEQDTQHQDVEPVAEPPRKKSRS